MKTFKELQERLAEAKVEAGRSDYGKASVRNKRKFGKEGEPAVFDASGERGKMIDQRRAEHKAKRGVKEEVVTERLGGKGYKPYTSLTGKKVSGDWEDSDRGAGNKAKKRAGGKVEKKSPTYLAHVHNKEEVEPVNEGEYSAKAAMYQSGMTDASRVKGPVGKAVDKVKKVFKKKEKGGEYRAKAAMYMSGLTKEEVVTELNRYGKETGKATGSINKRPGTPVKRGGGSDKALNFVRNMIRKETGKPEGQQKKVKGEKGRVQYGDRKVSPSTTIAKRRQAAKDADAAMRDTRGT